MQHPTRRGTLALGAGGLAASTLAPRPAGANVPRADVHRRGCR